MTTEVQTLLTIGDVRSTLQVSTTEFKRLRAEGKFPAAAVNLGTDTRPRLQRWTPAQVQNWVAEQSSKAMAA
ncbi:helix-turn-helix transcriptional regulator [Devosia sp.]|jgi:hypothetical protein|uniref:helix-turn-helix transcriptional regulator n=1 Tax=Devosia sp. TaxID=1871048 RepID=UPI0037C028CE